MTEEDLQNMFAGLLSATFDLTAEVHPDDAVTITRMNTADARALAFIYEVIIEEKRPTRQQGWAQMDECGEALGLGPDRLREVDAHLSDLGIIEHDKVASVHGPNLNHDSVRFTPKGRRFSAVCMRVRGERREAETE